MPEDTLISRLAAIVGPDHVLTDPAATAPHERDITGQYRGRARAVVRPGSTEEVARILALAEETRTPVVPQGGNTGLSGGGVPDASGRAIILSLSRMNRILAIRPASRIAIVEAGVILDKLREAAEEHDLVFPLVFGARGSCQIGGNLATNAGGSNVLRYGNTRALCLGIEAVLPGGEILDLMSELHKDNSGYDLRDLLIGSEGTLGVITRAVLRLFPKPKAHATAMVAMMRLEDALALLNRLVAETGNAVEAFEYMPANYFDILAGIAPDLRPPFDAPHPVNILVEIAATGEDDATPDAEGRIPIVARLETVLGEFLEKGLVADAVIARSEAQRAEMWARRERAFEVAMARGVPVANDIALPLEAVAPFLAAMEEKLPAIAPRAESVTVAHLGDGNLHYAVWPEPGAPRDPDLADRVMEVVEEEVRRLGGSFSAEHGIGVSKLASMRRRKNPVALATMKRIKQALDPHDIMNPGKLLP